MFKTLKKTFRKIKKDAPGERFENQYRRSHEGGKSIFKRILFVGGGIIVVIVGIIMLPAPGPGTIVVFLGLGLIGQESLHISRFLDKLEVFLRKIYDWGKQKWEKASVFLKAFIIVLALALCCLAFYAAYLIYMS